MKYVALIAVCIVALLGCHTVPTEIPDDLTQAELILDAQDAADLENWEAAIAYYSAIVERFPDDREGYATALYEIAFIHYKLEDYESARAEFDELLGMYETEGAVLPQWPKTLAERIVAKMDESADTATDGS
jgi:outer membrane protein assembly factor BamD (BamD/ComL family)